MKTTLNLTWLILAGAAAVAAWYFLKKEPAQLGAGATTIGCW